MSKSKPIHSAIHQLFGAEHPVGDAPGQPNAERFADGGGWAVSVTRGPRIRAAYSTNLAGREAAVADLKRAAATNKLYVWGTYENQRSKLHYLHGDPGCPKANVVFVGIAAKLARGQLACGCNRRAAAAARALHLSVIHALAETRGGTLLSEIPEQPDQAALAVRRRSSVPNAIRRRCRGSLAPALRERQA
jgi:hypothetical protein